MKQRRRLERVPEGISNELENLKRMSGLPKTKVANALLGDVAEVVSTEITRSPRSKKKKFTVTYRRTFEL